MDAVAGFVLIVLFTSLLWSFEVARDWWLFGVSYGSVVLVDFAGFGLLTTVM